METILLASASVALGIALVFLGLDLIISSRRVALQSRIGDFAQFNGAARTGRDGGDSSHSRGGPDSWKRKLATELARADLPVTPNEYAIATVLFAVVGLLFGFVLVRNPIVALVGVIIGMVSPRVYVVYLQRKRLDAFSGELEGALTMLSNTLRSGYGISQAFESVSKEFAPPLSTEFARVVQEVALGLSFNDAMANLLRRNPVLDLDLVITAINVNHEVGGNLSEVLDRIAGTIRDRVRLAGEVRALTAQQRLSATVLMILPFAVSFFIYLMNPDYISLLWQSTCGMAMIGTGGVLLVLGFFAIRRILVLKY